MKKMFIFAAMCIACTAANAQKKELTKARECLDACVVNETYKDDNGVEKQRGVLVPAKLAEAKAQLEVAKQAWEDAKADPKKAAKIKPEVIAMGYDIKGDLYFKYVQAATQDKSQFDTLAFYNNLCTAADAYEECFKLDAKGEYTNENKNTTLLMRDFIAQSGSNFFTNHQYAKAIEAFKKFLDFPKTYTITGGQDISLNGVSSAQIAYFAMVAAYNIKDYDTMLALEDEAMKYTEADNVPQFVAEAAKAKGDTARWESTLRKFVMDGNDNDAVVYNLVSYYFGKGDDAVLQFVEEAQSALPNNKTLAYARALVYQNRHDYDKAIEGYLALLDIDPDYFEAVYNIGVCYCNQGYAINSAISDNIKKMTQAQVNAEEEKVKAKYRLAEPFMLHAQELKPEEVALWASRLFTIYTVLGDKEKAAEYDALCQ